MHVLSRRNGDCLATISQFRRIHFFIAHEVNIASRHGFELVYHSSANDSVEKWPGVPHLALFKPQLAASFFLPRPLLPFRQRNNRELRPLPAVSDLIQRENPQLPTTFHYVILCATMCYSLQFCLERVNDELHFPHISPSFFVIIRAVFHREFNKTCFSSIQIQNIYIYVFDKSVFLSNEMFIQNRQYSFFCSS